MHPQLEQLRTSIECFLRNPEASLEVHCPEKGLSVYLSYQSVLARPRRSLHGQYRSVPRLVAPAPRDTKSQTRAQRIGFARTAREARHPMTKEVISIPQIETTFVDADDGADWCLAALQDVHGVGDSWLWITDLGHDDWPQPLPKPEVWPPAG